MPYPVRTPRWMIDQREAIKRHQAEVEAQARKLLAHLERNYQPSVAQEDRDALDVALVDLDRARDEETWRDL